MKNILRTGIIGCGKVAHLHARALQNIDRAELVAVWNRTGKRAAEFAKQYGVQYSKDITEMVHRHRLDMVIVCTPHPYHAAPAVEAMTAGAHVLVEKPMASSTADCDKMLKTSWETGKKLSVVSQRRWYAPVQRMRQAIDAGKISQPALGTVQMLGWRDKAYYEQDAWRGTWQHEGGGVLINQAPHQLDILLWMMGGIQEVSAFWDNLNHPYIEVDDTAVAIIRFKNGALGNILVSNSQKPGIHAKVHIHGRNGASVGVQTDGGAMFVAGMTGIAEPPCNDLWTIPGEEKLLPEWVEKDKAFFNSIDPQVYYMERQIEDFAEAIIHDSVPLVTGEDGRRTVELIEAIYRSQKERKIIVFS